MGGDGKQGTTYDGISIVQLAFKFTRGQNNISLAVSILTDTAVTQARPYFLCMVLDGAYCSI